MSFINVFENVFLFVYYQQQHNKYFETEKKLRIKLRIIPNYLEVREN